MVNFFVKFLSVIPFVTDTAKASIAKANPIKKVVKIPIKYFGKNNAINMNIPVINKHTLYIMAKILWIVLTFPFPQYWEIIILDPPASPNIKIVSTKNKLLAIETADSWISPKAPTIKVSTILTIKVIKFCTAIGKAILKSNL